MPRDKLPYYQLWVDDFDLDENVREMTDEEVGFYIRCLNHAWRHGGLPDDLDRIARIMNRSQRAVRRLWGRVGRCFVRCSIDTERLVNRRQENERSRAGGRSTAAAMSAARRWSNSGRKTMKTNKSGDANALPTHCERTALALPTQCYTEYIYPPVVPPNLGSSTEPYEWFTSEYRGEIPVDTWQTFGAVVNTPERLEALRANLPGWMETPKYRDGYGVPNAKKFLQSGVWLRPAPEYGRKPPGKDDENLPDLREVDPGAVKSLGDRVRALDTRRNASEGNLAKKTEPL